MQLRSLLFFALLIFQNQPIFSQKTKPTADQQAMDTHIKKLMKRMTLDEKIGQLNLPSVGFDVVTGPYLSQDVEAKIRAGGVGAVFNTFTPKAARKLQDMAVKETRLGIPLIFGFDVIHGHRTIFPQPIGLACSWDTDLVERTARVAAEEASADGLNWTFSPMVDICRDPRWGRISEGAGEDPFLGAAVARAMVKGYQGDDLSKNNTILACVKHFALYGGAEAGRDYNVVDMSNQRMFNYYMPPYQAAVDAGAATVMASFNDVNGTPAHANRWLLTDILRKRWGFKGFVVTDYTGIPEMIQHGIGDEAEVGRRALEAGSHMDMVGEVFLKNLKKLVSEKRVSEKQVDEACRLILEAKWKLGLFADPYRYLDESRPAKTHLSASHLQTSREAAQKSIVLLKNKGNVLPLDGSKSIAFISPQLERTRDLIGNWCGAGDHSKATTIRAGIESLFPKNNFHFAKGCNLIEDTLLLKKINPHGAGLSLDARSPQQMLDEAVEIAKKSEVIVVILGEAANMTGEAACRSMLDLPPNQTELLKALKKLGKPLVLVLMNGRPLTISNEVEISDAVVEAWFPGTAGALAMADVLFGKVNPSGKLCVSFPRNVGQVPIYYNNFNTGRPADENNWYTSKYLDVPNSPLFPFGFGLSYTTFDFGKIDLQPASGGITATLTVKNSGNRDGAEVVQLYIRDRVGTMARPLKELKGFEKIELRRGESRTLTFQITEPMLRFWDNDLNWKSEDGEFEILIGGSSDSGVRAGFLMKNGVFSKLSDKP